MGDLCSSFPDVSTLNLGGGYKVARMCGENATDLQVCGAAVKNSFIRFAEAEGRQLRLEIEPGTFLVANACSVVCSVEDCVSTKSTNGNEHGGYNFIKTNSGMTEVLRPSLYGAQHPLVIVPATERPVGKTGSWVVV